MKLNRLNSIMAKSVATIAACAALNATAGTAPAPKNPTPVEPAPTALFDSIGATLDVAYDTRYYFRGLWFADNIVTAALNVSIPLTDKLTWGVGAAYISTIETPALDVTGTKNRNGFDYSEFDLITSLSYDMGWGKLGAQYQYYGYPDTYSGSFNGVSNAVNDSELGITGASELGLTLTIPVGAANVYMGYYYDLRINGSYFQLAADYTIALTDWMSLVPSIQTGYGIDYYTGTRGAVFAGVSPGTTQSSGFTHTLFSLAAPIKLTKSATLTPYAAWNFAWQTRNYMNATADNEVFGGVKLSIAF
ncbi:MAG: hypothetical protein U1F81_14760 [Verrucomicrobiaceae bacterium]